MVSRQQWENIINEAYFIFTKTATLQEIQENLKHRFNQNVGYVLDADLYIDFCLRDD